MNFIDEVRAKRKVLANVLADPEYSGLREIVEELYPDKAHFIYELLQNAEDAAAKTVRFFLKPQSLAFAHDGRPFSEKDVWGITNIGKGTKKDDEDKIGRFGVGFKAVFAYSETPSIWSPTYSFQISDLVLPRTIPSREGIGSSTIFLFPFNNPKKSAEAAFREIAEGLNLLSETLLIFLRHVQRVEWEIDGAANGRLERADHSSNVIDVRKSFDGGASQRSIFLRFTKPVQDLPQQHVAIAYPLERRDDEEEEQSTRHSLKVVPATPGRVSVYFPAEKEVSGLRFHINAPFVPELSRASIKDTPANEPLFQQLAKLVAESLDNIRDNELLTVDFLNVLPHESDGIPKPYTCIRDAVIDAMKNRPLTPTQSKAHLPATKLVQGKAALKELLPAEELVHFFKDEEVCDWAVAAPQRYSNADRFLGSLGIRRWDIEHFVKFLQCCRGNSTFWLATSYRQRNPDKAASFDRWFESRDAGWFQRLYAMLCREVGDTRDSKCLASSEIVRLSDGSFARPDRSFFPAGHLQQNDSFPQVDPRLYSSGKSKNDQEAARKFLEVSGVREVGEKEQVQAILASRYARDKTKPSLDENVSHLVRFAQLVRNDPKSIKLFENRKVLMNNDGEWGCPRELYIDLPYEQTDLSAYFSGTEGDGLRKPLSHDYSNPTDAKNVVTYFAKQVGVMAQLRIEEVSCLDNPDADYLVHQAPGNESRHMIDMDFQIAELPTVLAKPSVGLAKLIWTLLARDAKGNWTTAKYRTNQTQPIREKPSQLAVTLRDSAWVPQIGGEFVRPADADHSLLPGDFEYAPGWKWLPDISFGFNIAKQTEEYQKKREFASELGFNDDESLNDAKWFAKLDANARQQLKSEYLSRFAVELPEKSPRNPERRAEKVQNLASTAPAEKKEMRQRSVSSVAPEIKKNTRPYLRDQYTNADGIMVCQICESALPFCLPSGEPFFEALPFIPMDGRLHYQNYLALCPNHAAMFQHVNESKDTLRSSFDNLDGARLPIVLGGKSLTVYFTDMHRIDLNAALGAVDEMVHDKTDG